MHAYKTAFTFENNNNSKLIQPYFYVLLRENERLVWRFLESQFII